MTVAEFLTPERTLLLSASTKDEALDELMDCLVATGLEVDRETLAAAVRKREKLMSTGIGQGIAVPHVRLPGVSRMNMAVGVSREGIADYESLDAEPVRIIVLIVAPQGDHEGYIRLLASTTDVLKQPELRRAVIEADDATQVYRILTGGGG